MLNLVLIVMEVVVRVGQAFPGKSKFKKFKKIYDNYFNFKFSEPLKKFRRRAYGIRQKQEFRATISIIVIIMLYLLFHSLQLYNVVRKWQLLLQKNCPTRLTRLYFFYIYYL